MAVAPSCGRVCPPLDLGLPRVCADDIIFQEPAGHSRVCQRWRLGALRVSEVCYLADYFAIVTGFSNVQVRAISQAIADQVEAEWERLPLRIEGQSDASWVVMDYGDVIVHILKPQEREFYNLEAFWGHAERIDFSVAPRG